MGRKAKHQIDGKTAVSCTTLYSDLDAGWKEHWFRQFGIEECDRVTDESTEFGRSVHTLVEKHLRGEEYHLLPNDRISTQAGLIIEWCKQAKVKPVILPDAFGEMAGKPAMEFEVQSKELLIVGHPDIVCTLGDDPDTLWIGDWKSSKNMKIAMKMQVATYAQAWWEMTGQKINQGFIIRVDKDPEEPVQFEAMEIHNIFERYIPIVRECKNVHDLFKGRGKWKGEI